MNNNQLDLQSNNDTEAEIQPPEGLPVVPPTLPPMDVVVGDADTLSEQLTPADAPIQTAVRPVFHVGMKFKDCGVQGNKSLFIHLSNIAVYPEDLIPDTLVLDGNITNLPNAYKNIVEYNVQWQTNGLLPVPFDMYHLCTKLFKTICRQSIIFGRQGSCMIRNILRKLGMDLE
jgi:hypothetical protein